MSDFSELLYAEIEYQRLVDRSDSITGHLQDFMEHLEEQESEEPVDIITYIKAPWGLNMGQEGLSIYPIQEFMLKMMYSLPLDTVEKRIATRDRFNTHDIDYYTEYEFLTFLHKEGMCNVSPEEHDANIGHKKNMIILRIGRRGTKTTLTQWISAYELYSLLRYYCPQQKFGVRPEQPIGITLVSTTEDQAIQLLAPARNAIRNSPLLRTYVDPGADSSQRIRLNTRYNQDHNLGSDSGLTLGAFPCSARRLRGPSNILVLLEEYGFFNYMNTTTNSSDKSIFEALEPSTADFMDHETRQPLSTIIVISTPLTRESHMYELEKAILDGRQENGLILNLPSYWINPNLAAAKLRSAYKTDPKAFQQEYDAQYMDTVSGAFDPVKLLYCRVPLSQANFQVASDESTYLGIDIGLVNDGTSLSVVAYSAQRKRYRLVHHEHIRWDNPDQAAYLALDKETGEILDYLDIQKIAERIDWLWKYYSCVSGVYDQFNAFGLHSHLTMSQQRLKHVEVSSTYNDRLARNMLSIVNQGQLEIYADAEDLDNPYTLLGELKRLVRVETTGQPPRVRICALSLSDCHDDQYSSVSRACWCAWEDAGQSAPHVTSSHAKPRHREHATELRAKKAALQRRINLQRRSRGSRR